MTQIDWLLVALAVTLTAGLALWLTRRVRRALRERFRRAARRALLQFQARIARHQLVRRRVIHDELILDPVVVAAMREHCQTHHLHEAEVRRRVEKYIDEIVPFFSVLSYYRFGYNVARVLLNLLYHVTVDYQDQDALSKIPKGDIVVYLPNHRSNLDYVVLAYVLVQGVSISYAVGEWARTWPLEYIFKSFGSYFIRRRFREPLYHAVLERYVQLITRHSVTQGIFVEGGLSRDGRLRPAKIGLLDYIVRTLREPDMRADIWLVPAAINYDRVLEDRTLIRELLEGIERPGRLAQLSGVVHFFGRQLLRLMLRRLRRYGRASINFGTPLSVRSWLASQPVGILDLPKAERLPHIQRLADEMLDRVGNIIPVTPVPLASAALLSFDAAAVAAHALLERMDELRDQLLEVNAKVVRGGEDIRGIWERARKMLSMRRLVVRTGDTLVLLPSNRPLLQYYANSIAHLLPPRWRPIHKAHEADQTLPHLRLSTADLESKQAEDRE